MKPEITTENVKSDNFFLFSWISKQLLYIIYYIYDAHLNLFFNFQEAEAFIFVIKISYWVDFHGGGGNLVFSDCLNFQFRHFISFNYFIMISSFHKRWLKLTHLLVETKLS